MFTTDTWLKIICSMLANALLFGIGTIAVLSTPALADNAKYALPAVVVASFVLSPFIASMAARRMRIRNWGRDAWQRGDIISG